MLTDLLRTRTTFILLLLVGATTASWYLSQHVGFAETRYAGLAVIVVAFFKARLVLLDFMELRYAPIPMRLAAEAWVAVVCTALCSLYWWSGAI